MLSVLSCKDVKEIDEDQGWISYAGDLDCKDVDDLDDDDTVTTIGYAMGTQFDPETTQESGILEKYIQESAVVPVNKDKRIV